MAIANGSSVVSAIDNGMARVNEGRRVSSKSPSLARAVEVVMSKETDETRFKSLLKSWQLTLKLDSDHTCCLGGRAGPAGGWKSLPKMSCTSERDRRKGGHQAVGDFGYKLQPNQ